jgi:hypothetical protein
VNFYLIAAQIRRKPIPKEKKMPVNPDNAALWANADVYISSNLDAALPASASAAFDSDWDLVGLLSGEDGFTQSRSEDISDKYAWGGMLVATSRKNFKLTYKFSTLEDNEVTRSLIWPGSTTGVIVVPVPAKIKIAFETRDDAGKVHRLIARNYAQVDVAGDVSENETDLTKVPLVATIFPDADNVLFDEQSKPAVSSIAITALTLALSLSGKSIGKLVATATYSDATTEDITALALWASATPAKATVSAGYVTAVATGTASISCSYAGVTSTAPSVTTVSS